MTDSIALGLDGLSVSPGSHLCALFRGIEERDQILVPFLREGLRAGHKCTCIIDDGVEDVRVAVSADFGGSADSDTDQPAFRSSKETYLRRGVFSTQEMLDFWEDSVGTAINREGFPFRPVCGGDNVDAERVAGTPRLHDL